MKKYRVVEEYNQYTLAPHEVQEALRSYIEEHYMFCLGVDFYEVKEDGSMIIDTTRTATKHDAGPGKCRDCQHYDPTQILTSNPPKHKCNIHGSTDSLDATCNEFERKK